MTKEEEIEALNIEAAKLEDKVSRLRRRINQLRHVSISAMQDKSTKAHDTNITLPKVSL